MFQFTERFSRLTPNHNPELAVHKPLERSKRRGHGAAAFNAPNAACRFNLNRLAKGHPMLTWALIGALLLLAVAPAAGAQVLYGSLTGNVTDQAGAAVAGAKVEALNSGTNVAKIVTTDERGAYQFSDL